LPLVAFVLEQQFFFFVYVFEKFIRASFVTLWDEEKLVGFYIDENLMKRERRSADMREGQKKRQLMLIFFLMAMSWVVCLLQGCVYLKLVMLCGVSYFMVDAKIVVCFVSFDGVWQWFSLTWEVLGGIYEWECGRIYLMS
jgi:hypothetical protein